MTPRLHEASFGWSDPRSSLAFTPIAGGPNRDQATDPVITTRDHVRYPTDQAWRAHLDHELEAAQRRGDHATITAATRALADLDAG